MTDFITMAHGNGGATMQELIRDYFVEAFDNSILSQGEDQARIALQEMNALGGTLAFSTDSFVIDPIFFPGGDIGKLAVCGTANDVAVCGAVPKYLSCGFILEEGLPLADLKAIIQSMAETAKAGAAREASEQVIQIVIDALVQPDGTAIPDEFKPTAAELLKAHENPELLAAVEKVKQHAIGKLEEAEKN